MKEQQFSDAFHWLDDNMVAALECPDEHFDWVFMLRAADRNELARLYSEKSPLWREAWAYVVAQGPVIEAWGVLCTALQDPEPDVSLQAALSIVDLHEIFPADVQISVSVVSSLREVSERAGESAQDVKTFLANLNT